MRRMRKQGFTLVELMVVIALIGVLVSIAIPQFLAYQARSRRSEAYVNLVAVANHQKTFHAETDDLFHTPLNLPYPDFGKYGGLSSRKMPWDAEAAAAFADLGFEPDGKVFYSYEVNTSQNCDAGCELCFTASAFGDVDGDGFPSAVMYVQPQDDAGTLAKCKSNMFSFGVPSNLGTGSDVYRQAAVNRSLDEY